MNQEDVNPIEKSQDIIDIVQHVLNWISIKREKTAVTHAILEAELVSILDFFGVDYDLDD